MLFRSADVLVGTIELLANEDVGAPASESQTHCPAEAS